MQIVDLTAAAEGLVHQDFLLLCWIEPNCQTSQLHCLFLFTLFCSQKFYIKYNKFIYSEKINISMKKRRNNSNNFQSTSSCRYLLQVHLIFVVKYRKKLLNGNLKDDMLQKLFEISKKYDFEIKTMNSDIDHLHMLVSMKPSISISQIVKVLKQESTIYIWKKYKQLLKLHFWKEHTFWSDGYFVASIGNANEKTI